MVSSTCTVGADEADQPHASSTHPSQSTPESDEDSSSTAHSTPRHLRCPQPSSLARKRKVDRNPSGKKRSRGAGPYDPKSISPQHVEEFPNESLCVVNNKLFCSACHECLLLKTSIIRNHIKSAKHEIGKEGKK